MFFYYNVGSNVWLNFYALRFGFYWLGKFCSLQKRVFEEIIIICSQYEKGHETTKAVFFSSLKYCYCIDCIALTKYVAFKEVSDLATSTL